MEILSEEIFVLEVVRNLSPITESDVSIKVLNCLCPKKRNGGGFAGRKAYFK